MITKALFDINEKILFNKCICYFTEKKQPSGISKEEAQSQKKLDLEKRLEGVQKQLGQTKPKKPGTFIYHWMVSCQKP